MTNWLVALLAVVVMTATADEPVFHPDTGLRIHHYNSKTPMTVPGGMRVETLEAQALLGAGAVFIDVLSIPEGRYDDFDGSWPAHSPRRNIPGSYWLPNVGFGVPAEDMQTYLSQNLVTLTGGNKWHPVVVYCIADCWMGWNAVQHLAKMGYQSLFWYADGTDGWSAAGLPLEDSLPVPVDVD